MELADRMPADHYWPSRAQEWTPTGIAPVRSRDDKLHVAFKLLRAHKRELVELAARRDCHRGALGRIGHVLPRDGVDIVGEERPVISHRQVELLDSKVHGSVRLAGVEVNRYGKSGGVFRHLRSNGAKSLEAGFVLVCVADWYVQLV